MMTCTCDFDKPFEVRCSFGSLSGPEKKPLTMRLFETDDAMPTGIANKSRPNLGTLVLNLADFANLEVRHRSVEPSVHTHLYTRHHLT